MTDELTGLVNRRGWNEVLTREGDRCRRHGLLATVLLIDLDDMKAANSRGHHEGDRLLRRCAAALVTGARPHDVVARVGGDEFAVLAVHAGEESLESLPKRLQQALRATDVRASIGAACLSEADTLFDACRIADRRMLAWKARRRSARSASLQ